MAIGREEQTRLLEAGAAQRGDTATSDGSPKVHAWMRFAVVVLIVFVGVAGVVIRTSHRGHPASALVGGVGWKELVSEAGADAQTESTATAEVGEKKQQGDDKKKAAAKKADEEDKLAKKEEEEKAAKLKKEAEEAAAEKKKEMEMEAKLKKEAEEKAAKLKKEAEEKAAKLKKEAEEKAAKLRKEAEEKAEEEKAAAERAVKLKEAQQLMDKAKTLKETSDSLKVEGKTLQGSIHDVKEKIGKTEKEESKEKEGAVSDRNDAEELRAKAKQMQQQAKDLDGKAVGLDAQVEKRKQEVSRQQAQQKKLQSEMKARERDALKNRESAVITETQALNETAAQRMCINLPGAKLVGDAALDLVPIVGQISITSEVECTRWCLKHAECKQAVFAWDTKTCQLFGEAKAEASSFRERWPWFNSSFCGGLEEKQSMLDMLEKVYDSKPWVPEPHNCSWSGESCMHTKCCADVCKANWNWEKCDWYTCYIKDDNYAGCQVHSPPGGWTGTKLGGHPNGEVGPAEDGKLIQGTKLYCFSVVMWDMAPPQPWQSTEGELADNWKKQKKGIMQCDDHAFFDGYPGGAEHNINSFVHAWKQVQNDTRWKRNDWVIKCDADAVFFPDHLRSKIQYAYKPPQGTPLYIRNTFYKFQFLGALEVLTREAMELYYERGWECEAHLTREGGEDYWMQQCLEGIGINFISDTALLHDKYASDENCGDPQGVAFHFYKKVEDWDSCWNIANDAWNNAHKGE